MIFPRRHGSNTGGNHYDREEGAIISLGYYTAQLPLDQLIIATHIKRGTVPPFEVRKLRGQAASILMKSLEVRLEEQDVNAIRLVKKYGFDPAIPHDQQNVPQIKAAIEAALNLNDPTVQARIQGHIDLVAANSGPSTPPKAGKKAKTTNPTAAPALPQQQAPVAPPVPKKTDEEEQAEFASLLGLAAPGHAAPEPEVHTPPPDDEVEDQDDESEEVVDQEDLEPPDEEVA